MKMEASLSPKKKSGRALRSLLLRLHRWTSLALAVFWLGQALTGILIVYHWEIEDAVVSTVHRPTDLRAIEARLTALAPPGSGRTIPSVWITDGLADRYDVTVKGPGDAKAIAVRIAGDGSVLRAKAKDDDGLFDYLVVFHQTLLAGAIGSWIVGISGIFLFLNLLIALKLAWPPAGRWRAALVPIRNGPSAAKLYSWHRALGLILVVPALLSVGAGVGRVFNDGLTAAVHGEAPSLPPIPLDRPPAIGFASAIATAETALPGSRLAMVKLPSAEDMTWSVRLLAPGERRRFYGTSMVFVDARSGTVRGVFPEVERSWGRALVDTLYALHTGELLGPLGRILVLLTGLWLAAMIVLGVLLWAKRRPRKAA